MFDILSIGDNCVDIYKNLGGMIFPGGNAVNVSVHSRREKMKVCYFGFFGNDKFGEIIRSNMLKEEVNIDYCKVLKGQTGYTIVELRNGNRFFIEDNLGVQINFYVPSELQEILSSSKINFFSGFTNWMDTNTVIDKKYDIKKLDLDVLKKINTISKCLAFDFSNINDFDFIKLLAPYINLAFFSIDSSTNYKLENFVEEIISFFRKGSILIFTMGKKGSRAFVENKIITQDQIEADVVDTLGCGDVFIGAFLSEFIKSEGDIKKCLLRGTQIATEKLKRFGAW